MTTQHTPTPWRFVLADTGIAIQDCDRFDRTEIATIAEEGAQEHANAAFIVTACNAHDALTARVVELEALCQSLLADVDCAAEQGYGPTTDTDQARAALKGAK